VLASAGPGLPGDLVFGLLGAAGYVCGGRPGFAGHRLRGIGRGLLDRFGALPYRFAQLLPCLLGCLTQLLGDGAALLGGEVFDLCA
jgi:hypothetical protein